MKKKIILSLVAVAALALGVVGFSAFEAHIINVTAHIENALDVDPEGIQFGTVFPQEYRTGSFDILLSQSFLGQDREKSVSYNLIQKAKPWTLNFGGIADVNPHNRSLLLVDPDQTDSHYNIAGGILTITTDSNTSIEDLFGANEAFGDVTAPRMVIPMGGNFTVETKVRVNPGSFYQAAGILVYGSDGNVVRLETSNWAALGMGRVVYMESQENEVKFGKAWDSITPGDGNWVWLKLSRTDNLFAGKYSLDGITWDDVTIRTPSDFDNGNIGDSPLVGLSVVSAEPAASNLFSGDFEFITFNGDYQNLCKFLSKTPKDEYGDVGEPSYFVEGEGAAADRCRTQDEITNASGILDRAIGDILDTWTVDLKVPPIAGSVGQDWPESCAQYEVPAEADYGCDIWVEVTGIGTY